MHALSTHRKEDRTRDCPVEVMMAIAYWLSFKDIVCASHVSARWRTIFRDHPNFYKCIRVESHLPTALDKYLSQLHASHQRPVSVTCFMAHATTSTAALLIKTFADNLHRLTALVVVDIHPAHSSALFAALFNPAPLLEKLSLFLKITATGPAPSIPCHIFTGHAPSLREVQFYNLRMPAGHVRAFECAVNAYYGESGESTDQCGEFIDVEHWLASFPSVREVGFRGAHKPNPQVDSTALRIRLERVETLVLALDARLNCNLLFLQSLPGARAIPEIRAVLPGPDTIDEMLTHIGGACELSIMHEPRNMWFNTCLRDLQTGRRRAFVDDPSEYVDPNSDGQWRLSFFKEAYKWEPRITEILFEETLWSTLSRWLPTFNTVTRLTLRINGTNTPLSALARAPPPISLPKLVQFTIDTVFEVSFIRAVDICAFVDYCIESPAPNQITIVLKGPIVVDDLAVCSRHFHAVMVTGAPPL